MGERSFCLILLGPPGSGKGTQAAKISKEMHMPHISTGDLFRENIKKQTPLGAEAQSFMNRGSLVPDEIVLNMLFERIAHKECAAGFLLDGFPRTVPQAEAFEKKVAGEVVLCAINLNVADEVILKRTEGRLTCKQCHHVSNRYFSPSKVEGVCDRCGGELLQRPDDKIEIVEERLRTYHEHTKPLIEHYSRLGLLSQVNGDAPASEVYAQLTKIINAHV